MSESPQLYDPEAEASQSSLGRNTTIPREPKLKAKESGHQEAWEVNTETEKERVDILQTSGQRNDLDNHLTFVYNIQQKVQENYCIKGERTEKAWAVDGYPRCGERGQRRPGLWMDTLDVGTESEATESFAAVFIGGFGLLLYPIVDLFGKWQIYPGVDLPLM